jgi:hypothetical protein
MTALAESTPIYTLHNTRCILGWEIFMNYCRAYQAADLARQDFPLGDPTRLSLESDQDRALEAHRTHQTNCPECSARKQELASLGE